MTPAHHVLLRGVRGPPPRVAEQALVVAEDDEVQVPDQRRRLDRQHPRAAVDMRGEEQAVPLAHVREVGVEGRRGRVAEEALRGHEGDGGEGVMRLVVVVV